MIALLIAWLSGAVATATYADFIDGEYGHGALGVVLVVIGTIIAVKM